MSIKNKASQDTQEPSNQNKKQKCLPYVTLVFSNIFFVFIGIFLYDFLFKNTKTSEPLSSTQVIFEKKHTEHEKKINALKDNIDDLKLRHISPMNFNSADNTVAQISLGITLLKDRMDKGEKYSYIIDYLDSCLMENIINTKNYQLLKHYASTPPLTMECLANTFQLVRKGDENTESANWLRKIITAIGGKLSIRKKTNDMISQDLVKKIIYSKEYEKLSVLLQKNESFLDPAWFKNYNARLELNKAFDQFILNIIETLEKKND